MVDDKTTRGDDDRLPPVNFGDACGARGVRGMRVFQLPQFGAKGKKVHPKRDETMERWREGWKEGQHQSSEDAEAPVVGWIMQSRPRGVLKQWSHRQQQFLVSAAGVPMAAVATAVALGQRKGRTP